jgi:hypothetical protein
MIANGTEGIIPPSKVMKLGIRSAPRTSAVVGLGVKTSRGCMRMCAKLSPSGYTIQSAGHVGISWTLGKVGGPGLAHRYIVCDV